MKAEGKPQEEIQAAVAELQRMRKELDDKCAAVGGDAGGAKWKVDKKALDECVLRRMFVVPAFEIHGGVAGLYDYGPPGAALKENLLQEWRKHFLLEDSILQIECTTLTPHPVLKASGHVDKFEDLMVKDVKTGECYRADKLLEDFIDNMMTKDRELTSARREELRKMHAQAGSYKKGELATIFGELGIKAPATGNDLTAPFEFNLMFQTSIGPTGGLVGFLRPETAQGMFVNFRRLYDYNNGKMPMGVAQIGSAYRNEIAPRGGLLRVREFTMAEIEFFVNPSYKDHAKFDTVAEMRLNLFPGVNQIGDGKTISPTLREAVGDGTINNQTLAYFMARTAAFLLKIGVSPAGLRFRQHLRTEMAHYACDCWDAEILMSTGWVECVGIADRSAYDLSVHAKATKTELIAREVYPEVREEDVTIVTLTTALIGRTFKQEAAAVTEALKALEEDRDKAVAWFAGLTAAGTANITSADGSKSWPITKDMVKVTVERKRVAERKFVPNVIEPSFGIGRIITGVLEHNFSVRSGDEQRAVLSFRPVIAPYKAVVLPQDSRIARDTTTVRSLSAALTAAGLACTVDDSGSSLGKRYSRSDEVGIPFALTIDFDTAKDNAVTIRERDSCAQVRAPIAEVPAVLKALCEGEMEWSAVMARFPVVTTGEDKAASAGAVGGAGAGAAAAAPAVAAASAPAHGGAGAGSAVAAPAASAALPPSAAAAEPKASGLGSLGVKIEGSGRSYGKFFRPADL